MVLGEDGFKMSKSRGNIIVPEEILVKYGADSLRQWGAMGAATGSDIMFNWNDVVAASRFQTKMWNITKFSLIQLEKEGVDATARVTALADRWLLVRLSDTIQKVSEAMDTYQFDIALKTIREFSWDLLADNYIELVKGRLYLTDPSRKGAFCHSVPPLMHSAGCSPRLPPILRRNVIRISKGKAFTNNRGSHSRMTMMRPGAKEISSSRSLQR